MRFALIAGFYAITTGARVDGIKIYYADHNRDEKAAKIFVKMT